MSDPTKLSIAIIGAGISGLTAAIALKNQPGIDVQIYERAHELREVGATIALGPNGLRTLERLGATNALDDNIAFRNKSGFPMVYRHAQTNEIVSFDRHSDRVVDPRHRTARYFRPHLQKALLRNVDPARLHLHKTFASLAFDDSKSKLIVTFADDTTASADLILGADGIHSPVRRAFVPTTCTKWTGWTTFRSVFPRSHVAHIPDLPDEAYHYWGSDRTLFISPMRPGPNGKEDLFAVVASTQSDPDAPDAAYKDSVWDQDGDVDVLRDFYKDWSPLARAVIDATPFTRVHPNTAASGLDTWLFGFGDGQYRVTVAGDAAHAHGGAFAAGGSLAIDDAWAFAQSVLHVFAGGASSSVDSSSSQAKAAKVTAALRLYERTRKAHTDLVLKTVQANNAAIVNRLRLAKVETDADVRKRMESRQDKTWIHEHDVEAAFRDAVADLADNKSTQLESRARL